MTAAVRQVLSHFTGKTLRLSECEVVAEYHTAGDG